MKNAPSVLISTCMLILAPSLAVAESPEMGEAWESTLQMTMAEDESFALPATTTTVCRPKGEAWNEPPTPEDSDCTMSEVKRSGNTITWSMSCTKPPATGSGRMTFDGDSSYLGEMTITSSEGTMLMKMSGHRTGECDLGARGRQVTALEAQAARGQAEAAKAMADACAEAARKGESHLFIGPRALCTEPGQLAAFCAALSTEAGYRGAKTNAALGVDLGEAGETCDVDPEEIHDALCVQALASESFEFLLEECPAESQVLAQRECAGRKYTELAGTKYQSFCGQYAQAGMEQQEAEQAAGEVNPKESAMKKAKKGLKGLFGK